MISEYRNPPNQTLLYGSHSQSKMAFTFPISCILALIFPILTKYFPKCAGKGSFLKSQIKSRALTNWRFAVLNSHFWFWPLGLLFFEGGYILLYCGTPTFWQRGLWDSCFQNPSGSSEITGWICVVCCA